MTDLIRRADAIDALSRSSVYVWSIEQDQTAHNWALNIIKALPSAELPKGELISRADAIEAVLTYFIPRSHTGERGEHEEDFVRTIFKSLPSADAVSREDYHNLLTATEDIDRALREYQAKDEKPSADAKHDHGDGQWYDLTDALTVERNEWIPCNERLPKKGEVVLITNGKGNVRCGQYRSEYDVRDRTHYWWWKGKTIESVLAWMPLPEPYKAESEEV